MEILNKGVFSGRRIEMLTQDFQKKKKEKKKSNLTTKIFIGLILGSIVGILFNQLVPKGTIIDSVLIQGILYVIGQGFIKLMQMLVVPLVFCSLVCGSMSIGDTKKLGTIGVKAVVFYICTTAFAIAAAIVIANLINPGIGLHLAEIEQSAVEMNTASESVSLQNTLLNIIPSNIFQALTEGIMLQIIFFALITGVLLAKMGNKAGTVKEFFLQVNDVMMEMTMLIMKVAPIGVFALIAKTFSEIGFGAIASLLKYVVAVLIALLVQCFVIYMILLKVFAKLNPVMFIKKFFPVMEFAFSTATSNATIPMSIETLEHKMGVSKKVSSFTVPLGATVNMDGTAIMQGVAVVFAAQAFHIDLTVVDYLTVIGTATLASIGTAGIPGVGLITLTMVFQSVGLPVEAIALIMGIDRILDMSRTAVNITGDAVCTTIIAAQGNAVDREKFYGEQEEMPSE